MQDWEKRSYPRSNEYQTYDPNFPFGLVASSGGNDIFTSFLCHCDGTNGSTSFTDSSSQAATITSNNGASVTTSSPQFGTGALSLNGSSQYLSVPAISAYSFGTGDFVVDFWVNPAANQAGVGLVSNRAADADNSWAVIIKNSINVVEVHTWNTIQLQASAALSSNTWTHVALVRSGTLMRLFYNGVQKATTTNSQNYSGGGSLLIGYDTALAFFNGKIDEPRLSKGTDRGWIPGFVPPAAPYS